MAITHNEVQVQWSAANSKSISSGSNSTSDAVAIDATAIGATITLKADNDGTPASGDTVDFFILYCNGDPDGTGSDEYDSVEHATFLARLNTYSTDTPGEDPAQITVPIDSNAETGFKVYAVNNSGGRAITVSAAMGETRG